jgi:hypothetical protein
MNLNLIKFKKMRTNFDTQEYNYDYSTDGIPFNDIIHKRNFSTGVKRNNSFKLKSQIYNHNSNSRTLDYSLDDHNFTQKRNNNENNQSNRYRINNLEERIFSLEKMLQYLDEFIHLREEEKNNNQNNITLEPIMKKINSLEKEIKHLRKEKEENKKTIMELSNKIINLEKQMDNYKCNNNMQDIIYSLSDKEKKLNLLINDFSDMTKDTNKIINNKMDEKINEFNIFNENRINELLILIQDINKIIEENEIKINKVNDNLQSIQKDNLNIIKIISIQEQKLNNFDLIYNEINNIKEKYYLLLNDYNINNNSIKNIYQ